MCCFRQSLPQFILLGISNLISYTFSDKQQAFGPSMSEKFWVRGLPPWGTPPTVTKDNLPVSGTSINPAACDSRNQSSKFRHFFLYPTAFDGRNQSSSFKHLYTLQRVTVKTRNHQVMSFPLLTRCSSSTKRNAEECKNCAKACESRNPLKPIFLFAGCFHKEMQKNPNCACVEKLLFIGPLAKEKWNWNYIKFCDNMHFIILFYFYHFQ